MLVKDFLSQSNQIGPRKLEILDVVKPKIHLIKESSHNNFNSIVLSDLVLDDKLLKATFRGVSVLDDSFIIYCSCND